MIRLVYLFIAGYSLLQVKKDNDMQNKLLKIARMGLERDAILNTN